MKKIITILLILCCFSTMYGQSGTWTELYPDNMPSQRYNFGICDIGDEKVIIFGGDDYGTDATLNETWIYDYKNNSWTRIISDSTPSARERVSIAKLSKNKVLLFGGSLYGVLYNDTWVFDIEIMQWQEMLPDSCPTCPSPRDAYSISQIAENKALLFSGNGQLYYNGETWLYDYEKNTWDKVVGAWTSADRPTENEGGIMAMLDTGKVLFYGGHGDIIGGLLGETWLYNLDSNLWTKLSPINSPPPLVASSMANLTKNKVIFWGGEDTSNIKFNDDAWFFDLNTNNWFNFNVDKKPHERYRHGIARIEDNKIFMFGGIEHNVKLDDAWLLTVENFNGINDINNSNDLSAKILNLPDGNTLLQYTLSKPENIGFKLLDITGRIIESIEPKFINEGGYQQVFNTSRLARGIYFIYINSETIHKQLKFIVN